MVCQLKASTTLCRPKSPENSSFIQHFCQKARYVFDLELLGRDFFGNSIFVVFIESAMVKLVREEFTFFFCFCQGFGLWGLVVSHCCSDSTASRSAEIVLARWSARTHPKAAYDIIIVLFHSSNVLIQ